MIEIKNMNVDLKSKLKKYATIVFYSLTFLWTIVSLIFTFSLFYHEHLYKQLYFDAYPFLTMVLLINITIISLSIFLFILLLNKLLSILLLLIFQLIFFSELFNCILGYAKTNATKFSNKPILPVDCINYCNIVMLLSFSIIFILFLKSNFFKNKIKIINNKLFFYSKKL